MSATDLQAIIAGAKKALVSAERKARFFRTQYHKHKPNPDLAASIKVLRESAVKEVISLKKDIKNLTGLLKRYADLEARKLKVR